MFVVDFLHEFELGVWKAVLTHLIRILDVCGEQSMQTFNKRFVLCHLCVSLLTIQTIVCEILHYLGWILFGGFPITSPSLKKWLRVTMRIYYRYDIDHRCLITLTHYDYFQVIIPAIEGLTADPHDSQITELLYQLATYHALAKLRIHTEDTLSCWESVIRQMTQSLRDFQATSTQSFKTKETTRERNARLKRTQGRVNRVEDSGGTLEKTLNLNTIKFHMIVDGPSCVRKFGTLDSYSTQIVSSNSNTQQFN
jgi:hypothetical protein